MAQSAKGRDCADTSTLPKAWLICDLNSRERGPRIAILQEKGYHVDKVSDANGVNRQWTEDLHQRRPDLLWIALHQPNTKQGTRTDQRKQRKEVAAAAAQTDDGRMCVLEGLSDNSSWQFNEIQELKAGANWKEVGIALCNLGVRGRKGNPTKTQTLRGN